MINSAGPATKDARNGASSDSVHVETPQRIEMGAGLRGEFIWQAYRAAIANLFDVSLPEGADVSNFAVRTAAWQGVHANLRRSWGSAQLMRRGPDLITGGADQIVLYVQVSGHVEHQCGDRVERVGPGDVVIYDHKRPIESNATAFENVSVMLDRDVVPIALLAPGAHGLRIGAETGIADLILAAIEALEARAGRLTMGEFEAAALAVAGLVAEPVRAQIERSESAARGLTSADRLRMRALTYIDAHLDDRTLNPERIAGHLNLSRSGLYRLLEPYGGVRHLILARRLDKALLTLLGEPDSHRSLGQVAKRHGFPTTAHFSRSFSERFGMPPRQYCVLVREQDTTWLAAQYERARFSLDLPEAWRDLGAHRVEA